MGFSRLTLALAMGLLAACSHERADPRGQPEIYRGPLTVVAKDHSGGTTIQRSAGARNRTTWLRPDGRSHDLISDGVEHRAYSWSSDRPQVEARYTPKREPLRYWLAPDRTEPMGACEAAGEVGRVWRHTSPPNFKNPQARITDACVTADGVMIRRYLERFPDGASSIEWEATSVSRAPLPADVFIPPSAAAPSPAPVAMR